VKKMKNHSKLLIAAIIAAVSSSVAFADLNYNPNWPSVKCRMGGKSFQYNPNGAPNYQSAVAKCDAFGGVDNRPAISKPKQRVTTKRN
jgi:hypothetical protein